MRSLRPPDVHAPLPVRTTASHTVLYVMSYAASRGLARAALVSRFDIDAAALDDVDGRIPVTTLTRLWNELPVLLDDPDMPLHVLEHVVHVDPPLNLLVALSSPTLGDALRRLARYERLNFDLADEPVSELVLDGERAHIVLNHEKSTLVLPTGAFIDSCLALLMLARIATQQPVMPLEVRFRHPTPRRPEQYRAAFGCPVTFDAERDRMTLRAVDLQLPHPEASRTLLSITERHAEQLLSRLPTGDDFMLRLRHELRCALPEGGLTLAELARELGLGSRTLQRRLAAEGTSLRHVLDDERRGLALHYIHDARVSLVDIAFLLGFADQSAFSRAFSRWTSRSPSDYRRSASSSR